MIIDIVEIKTTHISFPVRAMIKALVIADAAATHGVDTEGRQSVQFGNI